MDEIKIVITGCVGSGKTTAIQAISEIPIISTDVDATDDVLAQKDTTTVAMDYGEMRLDDNQTLKIYGTPGQKRFSYMWEILSDGALGIIILVNNRRPNPVDDLKMYLDNFQQYIRASTAVIGVTHVEDIGPDGMGPYYDYMQQQQLDYPIFSIDARNSREVRVMVEAMAAMISLDEEADAIR